MPAPDPRAPAAAPAKPPAAGLVGWLDRVLYPHQADHWDDEIFRARILAHLTPASRVLDIGAGAGRVTQMNFRGQAARVVGLDPDAVHELVEQLSGKDWDRASTAAIHKRTGGHPFFVREGT